MISQQDRNELIDMARSVAERRLSHGTTGNVSIRRGDHILITPTRSSLATVAAEELAVLDLDGHPAADAVPSKEAPLHIAVYRSRPDATAVAHTHSLYATGLSCLAGLKNDDALPPLTAYYAMLVRALPLVDFFPPGDSRLAELAGVTARANAAMLLRNHGPVAAAENAATAVDVIEEIELTAKLFLTLQGQAIRPLPERERQHLFASAQQRRTGPQGQQPQSLYRKETTP